MKCIIKTLFILLGMITFGSQAAYRASNVIQEIQGLRSKIENQEMRLEQLEKQVSDLINAFAHTQMDLMQLQNKSRMGLQV